MALSKSLVTVGRANEIWLVVSTPLKNMSSSVGMIIPNIWKIKFMFQTTNQLLWMVLRCLKCLQLFTP